MKKHIYYRVVLFLQPLIYLPALLLFKLFCHFKVEGLEHIKNVKGRIIIAANHSSEWDAILIRAALPFFTPLAPTYYVSATKESFKRFGWKYYIYGGFFFELCGAYSVYPGKNDYAHSLQNHIQILKQNRTLCIFPQGKLVVPGEKPRIRGGVAFLSHETETPVVPLRIAEIYKISLMEFILKGRKVTLTFYPALSPKEIVPSTTPTIEDFQKGAEFIMSKIGV